MWQEWRDAYEVTGVRYCFKFTALTPADYCLPFEDINDGFLYAVMMDRCLRFGSTKNKPPHIRRVEVDIPATAATRFDPGVCAVPLSNSSGVTMRMLSEWSLFSGLFEFNMILLAPLPS